MFNIFFINYFVFGFMLLMSIWLILSFWQVLQEAGMIATCTGVGAPIGLALMGAGTLATAYSYGLIDFNNNGIYINNTLDNQANFGFSMILNLVSGGLSGSVAKSAFKQSGVKVSQVTVKNVVSNVDQRGLYSTTSYLTQKYVVTKDTTKPIGKYLVEELVNARNPTNKDYVKKIFHNYRNEVIINFIYNNCKTNFLDT